jgi:thymidine kinase
MLTVYCGPMFAGKTTALISEYFSSIISGQPSIFLKPDYDTRYSNTSIVSHDGEEAPCLNVKEPNDLFLLTKEYSRIFIDEIQFLEDGQYIKEIHKLIGSGKHVSVSGLDMDIYGLPFLTTAMCMAMADRVLKLNAVCSCGAPATMTSRKEAIHSKRIELGGKESYESLCRRCYNKKTILR